jgi:hypothetical protein
MKSQINLLQARFTPKFEWVCASHFLGLIALTCVIGMASYGGVFYWQLEAQNKLTAVQKKVDAEQAAVAELSADLSARNTDPLLMSKLASFKLQTQERSILLSHIQSLSDLKQRSFSSLFDALSSSSSKDLWLTKFEVTPEALSLGGQVAQPRALPLWISQLSRTDFFKGQEFNVASLERSSGILVFELNSVDSTSNSESNSGSNQTIAQTGGSQ